MKIKFYPFLLGLIVIACNKQDDTLVVTNGDVFINEILASGDDWVELYNSSNQAVDIGGYSISDSPNKSYILPAGTSIPAKGFLLIYCDGQGSGLNADFRLSADGETVYLQNASGVLTDMVTFPALGANQSYARFPDGSESFAVTGNPSPGSSNGNTQSPVIDNVSRLPLVPRPEHDVTVKAMLEQVISSTAVSLFYKKDNGSFNRLEMTPDAAGNYSATIPKLNGAGRVSYYIEASNGQNNVSRFPAAAPQETLQYLITTDALPQLFINEFMATNQTCCPDPSGEGEFDDWIEIYNAGNQPVDLAGMYVSDNSQNPFKYKIPEGSAAATTIAAGGYLLIWADEQGSQGPLHANFKLAADGEDIGLYYIDGRTIDELTFGAQQPDISRGRLPNGGESWRNFTTPTPGEANQ